MHIQIISIKTISYYFLFSYFFFLFISNKILFQTYEQKTARTHPTNVNKNKKKPKELKPITLEREIANKTL